MHHIRIVELILAVGSVVMCLGMLAAVPWLVRRLPANYFIRPNEKRGLPWRIARNVVGFALIAVGVALLLLPGQGVLTIIVGLSVLDLPIKKRALCWLFSQAKIEAAIQKIRSKAGKPPLVLRPEAAQ